MEPPPAAPREPGEGGLPAPRAVQVCPLGGLGEVGMNCLAVEQDGWVFLVDCGVMFDQRGLGIDVVHPDFRALEPFADRIAGIFVTHGHEDHIGGVPYLLRRFDVPVWGPPYAMSLLRARAEEHEVLKHARLFDVRPREKVTVGPFEVEPIRVTHSIADATALSISTAQGTVLHTGDFKFDETPVDGERFDVERIAELAGQGISLLCSDSTNIDTPKASGSEKSVADALEPIVRAATGRVVVGLFASNVHRLRVLGEIARATGRYLIPLGRSVRTHARVARDVGYLSWPTDLILDPLDAKSCPRERVLGVATGTQAESNAALWRLARDEHDLSLEAGDTVVFSSRVIPGHEPEVSVLTNVLLRRGLRVISRYDDPAVHVSGHAARPEQARMIELARPRAFLPLHGTLHHLMRHASLARELGVASTCVLEDGDVGALAEGAMSKVGRWPVGRVFVSYGRELSPDVIRQRRALASVGFVVAVVRLSGSGQVGEMHLIVRGVIDPTRTDAVRAEVEREVRASMGVLSRAEREDVGLARDIVRLALRRALYRLTGFKPEVEVSVVVD